MKENKSYIEIKANIFRIIRVYQDEVNCKKYD